MTTYAPSITLHLTQDVIDRSESSHTGHCMIATALRERGARSINVSADNATFTVNDTRYCYLLPAEASLAVVQFDKDKRKVKPLRVKLTNGFIKPPRTKTSTPRGPTKNRKPKRIGARYCVRRYHGMKVVKAA